MTDSPASEMTLGSLAVAIGGDITPLIAKLDEARGIVAAFDRDMASGSAGLLRFTQNTTAAGTAAEGMAAKTDTAGTKAKGAADSLNKLSDANDRVTRTSKATSDALETEAQKNERLAAMVDRAAERMREQQNVAARTGPLPGITSAGIPADYRADPAKQNAQMGLSGGVIPSAVLTGEAEAAAMKGATANIAKEAAAMEELGGKTKVTSTAMREFITIPREIASGNFTRVPGSISILAQQMGLLNASTLPIIGAFGLAAAAVGIFGIAAIQGGRDARRLQADLDLTGGKAGLTADAFIKMAEEIGKSTDTSISSNKKLLLALTQTNDFTSDQMKRLVEAADQLSRATGQSSEEIIKDFAKMAESPTKYAESYEHAHIGVITPIMMDHIRNLERQGDKEEALGVLVNAVTDDIAKHTQQQLGFMEGLWDGFIRHVSDAWSSFKKIVDEAVDGVPAAEMLRRTRANIADLRATESPKDIAQDPIASAELARLTNLERTLQGQVNTQTKLTQARRDDAQAADRQSTAIRTVNDSLLHGIDAPSRYTDDIKRMNNALADSVRMSRDTPIGQILAAAAKSGDQGVRDLATHYTEAVDHIKRQDLPVQFKADSKAAREAASEAKKLANEAAALERRRQDAISGQSEEAATLEDVLKLYQNHVATLEDVNRAKAITIALSRVKLTADSEEGRQLAELVGHVFDLNKAIADETNERKILDAMRDKTDSLEIEAQLVGKSGWALAFEEERLRALSQAMKDHIPITDEFMAAIEGGARHVADATVAADAAKFFDTIDKNIRAIETEAATIGRASNTTDYATIRLRLLNEAKAKHIELTDENIRKIEAEARAQAAAQMTLNRNQRREQFSPTTPYEVQGSDFHAIDQQLGGKFKKGDDLRQLQQDLTRQRQIVRQYHADGLIDEKGYQERLTEIEQDGAAKRHEIQLATVNLQLSAAQDIAGSLAQIAKDGFGEQSKAYRAFFDIQKGFAIAQAALAMEQDIAQALSKGFPQNIPLIAQAAAQGAMIISDIRSIALTFADGGFVQGAGSGTSDSIPARLSNGEFVTNAQATAQWRPVLEAINAGRMPALSAIGNAANDRMPRVSVHNHAPGVEHEVRQIGPDEVEIIARRVVRSEAPGVVAGDMAQPNSRTAKAMRAHTSARPTRR